MSYIDWGAVKEEFIVEGVRRRIVAAEHMTVVRWQWDQGVHLPMHTHPQDQFFYAISGKVAFECGGEKLVIEGGDSWMIPGNVPHAAVFLQDTTSLDIFSPPREDMLAGTDPYVRAATKSAV